MIDFQGHFVSLYNVFVIITVRPLTPAVLTEVVRHVLRVSRPSERRYRSFAKPRTPTRLGGLRLEKNADLHGMVKRRQGQHGTEPYVLVFYVLHLRRSRHLLTTQGVT